MVPKTPYPSRTTACPSWLLPEVGSARTWLKDCMHTNVSIYWALKAGEK